MLWGDVASRRRTANRRRSKFLHPEVPAAGDQALDLPILTFGPLLHRRPPTGIDFRHGLPLQARKCDWEAATGAARKWPGLVGQLHRRSSNSRERFTPIDLVACGVQFFE